MLFFLNVSYKWKYIKMKLCDFKDHKVPIEKNTWICGAIFIVKEFLFFF